MPFECSACNYKTQDKSHYNRHLKSKKHGINNVQQKADNYGCPYCTQHFSRLSSLIRHKKHCSDSIITKQLQEYQSFLCLQELKVKVDMLEKQNIELKDYIKTGTPGITYNISIKNFVQKEYPNAPALEMLGDYDILKNESDSDDFMSTLVYYHNHNTLDKYLGDFLVKYYKTNDPAKQSIWNSDTSRLTYIIREILADKNIIWNHDYKGVKTKNYIVTPLLKYIRTFIVEYIDVKAKTVRYLNIDECYKVMDVLNAIAKIKQDIDDNILSNNIIKYIAPHFYMDRKEIKC